MPRTSITYHWLVEDYAIEEIRDDEDNVIDTIITVTNSVEHETYPGTVGEGQRVVLVSTVASGEDAVSYESRAIVGADGKLPVSFYDASGQPSRAVPQRFHEQIPMMG